MLNFNIQIDLEIVDTFEDDKDTIARIYYPNEGNKIQLIKGMNKLEFHSSLLHEIGNLFDWYISQSNQSENVAIREAIAENIAECLIEKRRSNKMIEASENLKKYYKVPGRQIYCDTLYWCVLETAYCYLIVPFKRSTML